MHFFTVGLVCCWWSSIILTNNCLAIYLIRMETALFIPQLQQVHNDVCGVNWKRCRGEWEMADTTERKLKKCVATKECNFPWGNYNLPFFSKWRPLAVWLMRESLNWFKKKKCHKAHLDNLQLIFGPGFCLPAHVIHIHMSGVAVPFSRTTGTVLRQTTT